MSLAATSACAAFGIGLLSNQSRTARANIRAGRGAQNQLRPDARCSAQQNAEILDIMIASAGFAPAQSLLPSFCFGDFYGAFQTPAFGRRCSVDQPSYLVHERQSDFYQRISWRIKLARGRGRNPRPGRYVWTTAWANH